jgi:hypothetical protein
MNTLVINSDESEGEVSEYNIELNHEGIAKRDKAP